jgi:hypothetical protein
LQVQALTVTSTTKVFKRGTRVRPAVPTNQIMSLTVSLPSVVQLDTDLVMEFAINLMSNLKIEHDSRTGINYLITSNAS